MADTETKKMLTVIVNNQNELKKDMAGTKKDLATLTNGQNELKKDMAGTKKMLTAMANSQSKLREDMMSEFKTVNKKIDAVDQKLTQRIDTLGRDLAYLEDDAPTREEHEEVELRLKKVESKVLIN